MRFRFPRSGRAWAGGAALLLLTAGVAARGWPATHRYLRAASLLLRLQDPKTHDPLAAIGTKSFDEIASTVESPSGPVPARLYTPRGVSAPPAMVVLHGVHHLGIEEPRLVAFARVLAGSGIEVLTPELRSLADYRVSSDDIAVIGAAAQWLHRRSGAKPGVLGLSFAGGLALVAAADPRFAGDIGLVVAVGAHDDLERVCRYFATSRSVRPDGTTQELPAHEYGLLVLVYAHIGDFFSPADADRARNILRLQLWEETDRARALLAGLTPEGKARMQALLDHRTQALGLEVLSKLTQHAGEMAEVSPHGQLARLRVPVLLLHGSGDSVIPASETLWLASEIPAAGLRQVLISPLITHVELGGQPGWRDKAALVEFMAAMLRETDALRVNSKE